MSWRVICTGLMLPVVVAAIVVAAGGAASGHGAPPCGPPAARTIAVDTQARVYTSAGVFGCVHGSAAPVMLGGSTTSCLGAVRVGPVALAGTTVAYAAERCGIDTGSTSVVVQRLTDGHQLGSAAAGTPSGPESYTTVTSIVVRSSGSVAWIAVSRSLGAKESRTEVWRLVHGSLRRLAATVPGTIETDSLRLRGRRLTWRQAGRTRSATLA